MCEKVCPYGAISMKDGLPQADDKVCMGCGWCMGQCPAKEQVINMVRRDNGEIIWTGRGEHKAWCRE